jgi:hypothetical protein
MKRISTLILLAFSILLAETLFEVKDASNNKVLDVSTDGLRVLNQGDTLMVISSTGVRVNLLNLPNKALSRTFAVTTSSSKNKGLSRVLEVGTESTIMREGDLSQRYTDFSPSNILLGLNSGSTISSGINNVIIGNEAASTGAQLSNSVFIGDKSGKNTYGEANVFIGSGAGQYNSSGGYNTYLGWLSGAYNNGSRNVCIGPWSGVSAQGDVNNDNILIGYNAGWTLHGSGNILIGNDIDGSTYNNRINIGNIIYGTLPNTDLTLKATTITADGNFNVTGNSSISGATTSTGLISAGNIFRIVNNPGTGTTPTYYAYQGSTGSTAKSNAFAINDALWVAKNAFIDGTTQFKGGTVIGKVQAGELTVGTGASGINSFSLTFPTAFTSTPKVILTPRCADGVTSDIFVANVRNITITGCIVMIYRLDSPGSSWGQNLNIEWYAWE